VRPSKSAQKKASRVSRLEKKQQKSPQQRTESPHTGDDLSPPPPPQPFDRPTGESEDAESVSPVSKLQIASLVSSRSLESSLPPAVQSDQQQAQGFAVSRHSPENTVNPMGSVSGRQPKEVSRQDYAATPQLSTIVDANESKKLKEKRQNVVTRTLWTFIMIGGFIGTHRVGSRFLIIRSFDS